MAFSWTSVTAGSTIALASHANQVRDAANTLITAMENGSGCSSYSCSSLSSSLPAAVTAKTTIINTAWLTNMQATVDRIDTNKYCTVALRGQYTSHNPANCSPDNSTNCTSYNTTKEGTHQAGKCITMGEASDQTTSSNYAVYTGVYRSQYYPHMSSQVATRYTSALQVAEDIVTCATFYLFHYSKDT